MLNPVGLIFIKRMRKLYIRREFIGSVRHTKCDSHIQ